MNQNYKISIIVPAYNVENYIEKCINSILNQTYKNIEVIVVNDGSTDNTLNILEEISKKDNRVILINQKNSGVSNARNNALEKVNSDFIMFVDSDDWLDENTCEEVLNEAIKENADIVMFGYVREYENKSLSKAIFDDDKIVFEKQDVQDKLRRRIFGPIGEELKYPSKLNSNTTIWAKLYRTDLIKNIKFRTLQELGICEDGYFNIEVLKKCNKVVYIKKYFYHYRKVIGGNSLTQKNEFNIYDNAKRFNKFLNELIKSEQLSSDYEDATSNRLALCLIERISSNNIIYKNIKEILNDNDYRNAINDLKVNYMPFYWKVFFGLAKIRCTIGIYIMLKCINMILSSR